MNQMEHKHWPAVLAIALIGFSFWWLNKSWKTEVPADLEDVSYEMPRPKTAGPEYDISGRRVVYNLTETERKAKAAANGVVPKTPTDPKLAAKAAADAKKKEDAKKTAQNAKKKSQMGIRISESDGKKGLSADSAPDSARQPSPGYQALNDTGTPPPADQNNEPKKSAAQWRATLFAAPTNSNGTEFFKAYRAGDVDPVDFYKITEDLLSDSGADRQKLSLFVFKMDSSVNTFSILVSHYTDKTPDALKAQIYDVMKTYGELSHFSVLSRLLYSANSRVVTLASEVLKATVAAQEVLIQGGNHPSGAPIPPKNFQTFIPALRRLAQGGDASAQTLLASIEALMTAAATA